MARGRVHRGAVVKFYKYGGWHKGIVLRLRPENAFSRAYGRQAVVSFYDGDDVMETEVGVGDMQVIGKAKRVPKTMTVLMPPHPDEVAHHERIRDIRRAGQGAYYDPMAEHNLPYEKPLPGHERTVVAARHARRHRRR